MSTKLVFLVLILTNFKTISSSQETRIEPCLEKCFCDKIEPFLVDCRAGELKTLQRDEEWIDFLQKTNKTVEFDVKLDVRFDGNELEIILPFPELNIVTLTFRNNNISSVEERAFEKLDNLTSLDLSWNHLTAKGLPERAFAGRVDQTGGHYLPMGLLHLNLSHNDIHSIDKDLFDHLPFLLTIDLSFNPIKTFGVQTSQSISSLVNLNVLFMHHTGISDLPDGVLHSISNLSSLDLSYNEFDQVPKELKYCTNLQVLNLDGNLITTFDYVSFEGLGNLETLMVSYMPTLKVIETRSFGPLKKLRKLVLSHNPNLNELSDDIFLGIPDNDTDWPIRELHLNDNGLTHLDRALANWKMIEYIDIQNNPFKCDCKIEWMTEVLVEFISRDHKDQLNRNIKCSEPESARGSDILTLSIEPEIFENCRRIGGRVSAFGEDFDPQDPYRVAGITLFVIGMMMAIICFSILGVLLIKRRAIAQTLQFRQTQIRYERAESEEEENHFGRKKIPTVTVR